jgi:hypothetical protein
MFYQNQATYRQNKTFQDFINKTSPLHCWKLLLNELPGCYTNIHSTIKCLLWNILKQNIYIYIYICNLVRSEFYIHGSMHRNSVLIRSNKMQQYAGIYLLQNHSTRFGYPSHPSSGVHKTVTAASGKGHSIWATPFLHRGVATLEEGRCSDTMTCTRGCS